jgi:hypothetical protein
VIVETVASDANVVIDATSAAVLNGCHRNLRLRLELQLRSRLRLELPAAELRHKYSM